MMYCGRITHSLLNAGVLNFQSVNLDIDMDISRLIIHPSPSTVPSDTPLTVLLKPSFSNVSPFPSESPPTVAFLPSGVNSVLAVSSPLPPAQPAPPNAQPKNLSALDNNPSIYSILVYCTNPTQASLC